MQHLAEVPGLGIDRAQQIIAEVERHRGDVSVTEAPRVVEGRVPRQRGECGNVNYSHRCPKGNRQMRRVLNQATGNAAVKAKGTIFAVVYRRLVPRLGHAQAIGAITHRLCRLIWKILHERVPLRGARAGRQRARRRRCVARKMIRDLRTVSATASNFSDFIGPPGVDRERFSTLTWLIREAV